jgi:hypothetical protein
VFAFIEVLHDPTRRRHFSLGDQQFRLSQPCDDLLRHVRLLPRDPPSFPRDRRPGFPTDRF